MQRKRSGRPASRFVVYSVSAATETTLKRYPEIGMALKVVDLVAQSVPEVEERE